MHLALTTMWMDWLAGTALAGKGVNDFLAGVPRLAMDAAPPENVQIFATPYTDAKCAEWKPAAKLPAIYVMPDGPIVKEGEVHTTNRDVPSVAINARLVLSASDPEKGARFAEYYLRAMERSTAAWLEAATAYTTRNGIHVVACNRMLSGPWNEAVGEAKARSILALDLQVRDDAPHS